MKLRALGALKLARKARDEDVPAKRADFLFWATCWIFKILIFHVIIFNNQNQLKTLKIQLQFILVLSTSKIVDSTYKLVILKIHRTTCRVWSCFVCSSRSFRICSTVLTTICFNDCPLVYIIYLKVSHNLVI